MVVVTLTADNMEEPNGKQGSDKESNEEQGEEDSTVSFGLCVFVCLLHFTSTYVPGDSRTVTRWLDLATRY